MADIFRLRSPSSGADAVGSVTKRSGCVAPAISTTDARSRMRGSSPD